MSAAPLVSHPREDGITRLAICTGVETGTFAVTQLVSQERDPGWIVSDGSMTPWKIAGFRHDNGLLYVVGADLPVTPFRNLLEDVGERQVRVSTAVAVYRAIRRLDAAEVELPVLSLTGIFVSQEGSVFLAPPGIIARTMSHLTDGELLTVLERHTHPDLPRDRRDAMALGVWVYRILTGDWPFPGRTIQETRDRFRASVPRPPRTLRPELEPAVADDLEALLRTPSTDKAESFIATLEASASLEQLLSPQEGSQIQQAEEKRFVDADRRRRQRRYLTQNWKSLAISGIVLLIILSVPFSILRRVLEPSGLEGLSPTEVTRTFYYAMNDFDHPLMEEAVVDRAAESKLREVTSLYIFSRMQGAMEGSDRFVDAQAWRDDGMPELRLDHYPYGVANLRVDSVRERGDRAVLRVSYEKWEPLDPDEATEPGNVSLGEATRDGRFSSSLVHLYEEELILEFRRDQWYITAVETLSRERRDPASFLEEAQDQ